MSEYHGFASSRRSALKLVYFIKNRKITAFNSACGHAHNFFPLEKIITKDN